MAPSNDNFPTGLLQFEGAAYSVDFSSFRSGGCQDFTTAAATAQGSEPQPAPGMGASHSVWVTHEPIYEGAMTAWLEGSEDNVMSAYDWGGGGPVSGLGAPVAQGDNELGNQPSVTFNVDPAGVTGPRRIVFQIDTRGSGSPFRFLFKRSDGTPPAYDNFADAYEMIGLGGEVEMSLETATAECEEPARLGEGSFGSGPYNTVWAKITPTRSGIATVYLAGYEGTIVTQTTFHTGRPFIDVFTGSTLGSLSPVPHTQHPNIILARSFTVVAGVPYYIRVDSQEVLDSGPFRLVWETNALNWHARVGTFGPGESHIETGLPGVPTAVMIWASGADAGATLDSLVIGWGGSDIASQFAAGFAHPFVPSGVAVNGEQFQKNVFSTSSIIELPDPVAGVFASAALSGVGYGSFDLAWSTVPGTGSFGYLVVSGIEASAGIENFDRSEGIDNDVEIVPGIRTRLLLVCIAGDSPLPNSGGVPAKNFGLLTLAEDNVDPGLHLGGQPQSGGFGIETGISWFGGADDEGDFQVGGVVGINYAVTSILEQRAFQGVLSYTVRENPNDADWSGDYGWLALGGYGWHAFTQISPGAFDTDPDTLAQASDFWIEAGLVFGINTGNTVIEGETDPFTNTTFGAFDAADDDQFSIGVFGQEHRTGFAGTTVQTPVGSSAHANRVMHAADTTDTPTYNIQTGYWVTTCPGDRTTFRGTTDRLGPSPYPVGFPVLFGNFTPAAPEILRKPRMWRYRP